MAVAGAAGRLIMRVLALTSPPSADGQITEAQEVVGEISVGGALSLFAFGGAITGVLATAVYVVLYRWLPSGHARGVAFGALTLVCYEARASYFASRCEVRRTRHPRA